MKQSVEISRDTTYLFSSNVCVYSITETGNHTDDQEVS